MICAQRSIDIWQTDGNTCSKNTQQNKCKNAFTLPSTHAEFHYRIHSTNESGRVFMIRKSSKSVISSLIWVLEFPAFNDSLRMKEIPKHHPDDT